MEEILYEIRALNALVTDLSNQVSRLSAVVHRDRIKYTIEEAANRIKRSRSGLYELLRLGELQSIKEGGRRYVTEEQIASWERRQRQLN